MVTKVDFGPTPASPAPSRPSLVSTGLQVGQTPAPAQSPADPLAGSAASQVQVRTSPKGAFVNLAGGAPIERGVTSINMGSLSNGESGILASANRSGTPKAAVDLRPDDRVTIEGHETTVAVATRLGYLTRDPAGGYRDNTANLAAAEAAQQEAASDPHYGQALDQPATEALGELVRSTTAGSQVKALLNVIDTGEVGHNALVALASEMGNGTEPEAVATKVNAIMQGFKAQVATLAASHGADVEDFGAWAREQHGAQFKEAVRLHGMNRTTAAYQPLLRSYMENLDRRNPDAILNANFPTPRVSAYRHPSGQIVLKTPQGEVSWQVAVRTGLIKPFRS
jgi:hypothetical protein